METIELKDVMNQLPVVENLKNFAGIDAQNALGMMSPERLAAVVGGKLDCYIGKLKTTASSNNTVNLAREIIEKIPEGYLMFVCYVETGSNNIFSYGYMYYSKKYGVIHIDSYFSCQAVALINGEYKLIA